MKPTIGEWYKGTASQKFEVIAYDEDDGSIEIQYSDGTVEEMDIEEWDAEVENGDLTATKCPDFGASEEEDEE